MSSFMTCGAGLQVSHGLECAPDDDLNALNIALRDFIERSEVFEAFDVLRKGILSRIQAELRNRRDRARSAATSDDLVP